MRANAQTDRPNLFLQLVELGCLEEKEICAAGDGFYASAGSIADVLKRQGIENFPGKDGEELECGLFFDDWYLYSVSADGSITYSLFKMREQEYDAKLGLNADGDVPGITVCFIAMNTELLLQCLAEPTAQNRKLLGIEINRVVAYRGQKHSAALKEYFIRTEAQGPYLIAQLYMEYIGSLAENGSVSVPEKYAEEYKKSGKNGRIPKFIEENNKAAGAVVCDHERIYVRDPKQLSKHEKLAILATHTGNTSIFSFAAEVQFHARFLTAWAKIPIPFIGKSVYDSAIRADMSIGDAEFTGVRPYYRSNSGLVKAQYCAHKDEM